MKMKNRQNLAFLFFASLVLASCGKAQSEKDGNLPLPVRHAVVEERNFVDELVTYGSLAFSSKNDVSANVEGTLRELRVKEGDYVLKGSVIARLENIQLSLEREKVLNEIKSAESSVSLVRANLRDAELGVETRLLSIDRKKIEIRQKEIEIEEARASLVKKSELYQVGGMTEESHKGLLLSVSAMETELELMRKDLAIQSIGLRDSDLSAGGYPGNLNPEKRIESLVRLNTDGMRAQLAAAEVALLNAKKTLESTDRLLDALILRSPMAGYIGAKYFEPGEFIEENAKVITIIDVKQVDAVFHVQEEDVGLVSKGMPVDIAIDSVGMRLNSSITEVSPMADPQTGNFTIKARLPNDKNTMRPGMFIRIRLKRKEFPVLPVLPATCITERSGTAGIVFEIVDGLAVRREVVIEREIDGEAWLSKGPKKGRPVIDKPSSSIREGSRVSIQSN